MRQPVLQVSLTASPQSDQELVSVSFSDQPESAGMVRTTMFLGIAFTEALALIGFVVFILLKYA
jgi:flagellar biogenesis protein FliO